MTLEERLKVILGDLVFQNAVLLTQITERDAKIKELETPKPDESAKPVEA